MLLIRHTSQRNLIQNPIKYLYPFQDLRLHHTSSHISSETINAKCMCERDSQGHKPSFCPCRIKCECGGNWDCLNPIDDGCGILYGESSLCETRIYKFMCERQGCANQRIFNGYGQGIAIFYQDKERRWVMLTTTAIIKQHEKILDSGETLVEQHTAIQNTYDDIGFKFINRDAYNGCFVFALKNMVLPFQPLVGCPTCDCSSIVMDGVVLTQSADLLHKHFTLREKFNHNPNTLPFPTSGNGMYTWYQNSLKYEDISFTQGEMQERLIEFILSSQISTTEKFRRGHYRNSKGNWFPYSLVKFNNLREQINRKKQSNDKLKCIHFLLNSLEYVEDDGYLLREESTYFLDVQQALVGSKSFLKYYCPDGPAALIYACIMLSAGKPLGRDTIPRFLLEMRPREEINITEAKGLKKNITAEEVNDCKVMAMQAFNATFPNFNEFGVIDPAATETVHQFRHKVNKRLLLQLLSEIELQLPYNDGLRKIFQYGKNSPSIFETSHLEVSTCIRDSFPPLHSHIIHERANLCVSSELGAQLAIYSEILLNIWLTDITFVVESTVADEPIRKITLPSLVSDRDANNEELVQQFLEQRSMVQLGNGPLDEWSQIQEDIKCGSIAYRSENRFRRVRATYHYIDKLNKTKAAKTLMAAYIPDYGNLGEYQPFLMVVHTSCQVLHIIFFFY